MAHFRRYVKDCAKKIMDWIEDRPRLGWYLTLLLFINYALDIISALH
jgi:hypothetical protein